MVIFSYKGDVQMARFFKDDFWGRVEQRVMDLGLNMKIVSRQADIPYSTLFNQKTRGEVPTKMDQIEKMASVLGCSINYLIYGTEKEKNTLSDELMELVTHFKVLTDGQKKTVLNVIDQFTKDNQKYAEVYLQLHPVEP